MKGPNHVGAIVIIVLLWLAQDESEAPVFVEVIKRELAESPDRLSEEEDKKRELEERARSYFKPEAVCAGGV